ncbi:FtsX-like permease family protein [Streptomyces sp. NPDC057638]|uniref:FtsX-like permease family protein n=1 Tax=Streptomyces sp. NPDC057638 TaxID=3346190 RepID=UPI0036AF771E
MTQLHERHSPTAPPVPARRGALRSLPHDLGLGIRFAVRGGREGWIRTLLTALGIGLGVALLLVASSVPRIMVSQQERDDARTPTAHLRGGTTAPTATSVLWADASTEYRDETISGSLLRPDGARPALPPGLDRLPGPGEMAVSPALAALLDSPGGAPLAERLGHRVVATIGADGLLDPGEYRFYAGSDTLTESGPAIRTDGFGGRDFVHGGLDPILGVLAALIVVVLLIPVVVFIATAFRFGGERRDQRLAALRLVGADARTTRRIAVGESLTGAVLGLATGAVIFAAARPFAGSVRLWGLSAYAYDVVPLPGLAVLIVAGVLLAAVVVTLVALRSVVVEPLGVVRSTAPRRRRLWWRLALPAAGVALVLGAEFTARDVHPETVYPVPVTVGSVLVLLGVAALLPWLLGSVVARLRPGGPVSWQLAVRGLQLRGDAESRAVSGIMVAVSGAIALQMVFAGMLADFQRTTGSAPSADRFELSVPRPSQELAARMAAEVAPTEGVRRVTVSISGSAYWPEATQGPESLWPGVTLTVADCAGLRKLARLPSCADGDAFVALNPEYPGAHEHIKRSAPPGARLVLADSDGPARSDAPRWTLPKDSRTVFNHSGRGLWRHDGVLVTPGALGTIDPDTLPNASTEAMIEVTDASARISDAIRDTAARIDPSIQVSTPRMPERDQKYASMQTGLLAGATATLGLIAASMVISQTERLRERRRLLAALSAFGARRATLVRAVLWQTALPVLLGTAVAVAGGLALGASLLALINKEVADWWLFLPVAGVGASLFLLVTAGTLPFLWRMVRPDGLRTE